MTHENIPYTEERADSMIKFLTAKLEHDFEIGEHFIGNDSHYCFDCGEKLYLSPTSENSVALIDLDFIFSESERQGIQKYHPVKVDVNSIPECSVKPLREIGKLEADIQVPTGELLFANFFREDKIYTMPDEFSNRNSINAINGRNNLMQYLAGQNIGYGQMGNMSVNVFVNDAGDEIIIGTNYGYNEEDGEFEVTYEGFTDYGSICLDVWRWMCGDIKILKEHGEKIPDNLISNKKTENEYHDYILAIVKPGTWHIDHFYDFDEDSTIYSKLYLKK